MTKEEYKALWMKVVKFSNEVHAKTIKEPFYIEIPATRELAFACGKFDENNPLQKWMCNKLYDAVEKGIFD